MATENLETMMNNSTSKSEVMSIGHSISIGALYNAQRRTALQNGTPL